MGSLRGEPGEGVGRKREGEGEREGWKGREGERMRVREKCGHTGRWTSEKNGQGDKQAQTNRQTSGEGGKRV